MPDDNHEEQMIARLRDFLPAEPRAVSATMMLYEAGRRDGQSSARIWKATAGLASLICLLSLSLHLLPGARTPHTPQAPLAAMPNLSDSSPSVFDSTPSSDTASLFHLQRSVLAHGIDALPPRSSSRQPTSPYSAFPPPVQSLNGDL